jgi:2-oxoisovalerate dehydrogenase E2 component (dihydrolipoyl transacylase)
MPSLGRPGGGHDDPHVPRLRRFSDGGIVGIHVIKMPDIGEGIAEVEVVAWHVKPDDDVAEDQLLAEVMTDKATVEVPSPVAGKVLALGGKVGELMAVGAELVRIEVDGPGNERAATPRTVSTTTPASSSATAPPAAADVPSGENRRTPAAAAIEPTASVATSGKAPVTKPATGPAGAAGSEPQPTTPRSSSRGPAIASSIPHPRPDGARPLASPAVRRRAWDLGIELQFLQGSGNGGVILHEDLDAYLARRDGAKPARPQPGAGAAFDDTQEAIPVIGLRRRIAQKMQDSKRRIPHYSYVEEIDVTELEVLRGRLNARWGDSRGKLTLLPLLLRALVVAVKDHPEVNAVFDDEAGVVTRHAAVHAGIATQTPAGLMVPVLKHAQTHDLWSAAAEITRLAEAARTTKIDREELSGSTITITSLGPLGGIVTTPVINHPEVAIVGVNRIVERPVVREGAIVIRKIMNLSSSFDHRVVDGMDAARFIQSIRGLLECPALLFVEPS